MWRFAGRTDLPLMKGTVASPEDVAQAEMLVDAALNPGVGKDGACKSRAVNRLRSRRRFK